MLRLPAADVLAPTTLEEAISLLADPGARLVAGGTDLLPNLKHRLERPARLVSLHRVRELGRIERDEAEGVLRLGAGVTLARVAADPDVREAAPMLAEAARAVAGPQIRNQATLGGNLNLDTRCRYVNQTEFWRSAIGGCLKAEGDVCHVVPGGRKCVAALSSDCAPALIALDARITLASAGGTRQLALAEYYRADGLRNTVRASGEILTDIRVPLPTRPRRTAYVKWRVRGSIDFPLVSVALRFDLADETSIAGARVVAGVLGARPREVRDLERLVGRAIVDPEVAEVVADAVRRQCRPLANVPYDPAYRHRLYAVLTYRAVRAIAR